jgi:hypothetical protein
MSAVGDESAFTADDDPDDGEYTLLYPFVVCKTNGGPWDDEAFVAGVRFGELAQRLKLREVFVELPIEHALVPQVDLLAMHEGYSVHFEPCDTAEGWTNATLSRGDGDKQH